MYELMASAVLAAMNALHLEQAALVGWSDDACTALILAAKSPLLITGVFLMLIPSRAFPRRKNHW
jgi:pimeloyl-ACP methyl ester carboxylesterase